MRYTTIHVLMHICNFSAFSHQMDELAMYSIQGTINTSGNNTHNTLFDLDHKYRTSNLDAPP